MLKIGISSFQKPYMEDLSSNVRLYGATDAVLKSISKAGALPILIPLDCSKEELEEYFNVIDGLLITGGEDVEPARYNQNQMQGLGKIDAFRDESDLKLIDFAFKTKTPIFGICRGLQILNVYCKGTLIQDLRYITTNIEHSQVSDLRAIAHQVTALEGSILKALFNDLDSFGVNSLHHQCIDKLGENLIASIKCSDGIIEGIELNAKDHLVVAVQFHPEFYYKDNKNAYMMDCFKNFLKQINKKI